MSGKGDIMGAGQHPKYGTLVHKKLRVGREALVDGEKVRAQYLGTVTDLSKPSSSVQSDFSSMKNGTSDPAVQ
jgi:hypothetical protein